MNSNVLFAKTPPLKLFFLASIPGAISMLASFAAQSYMLAIEKALPASVISISTALIFPVLLVILLWPLGLTGIWLNFAGTALLAPPSFCFIRVTVLLLLQRQAPWHPCRRGRQCCTEAESS